jgi:hypothetical protein
MFWWELGRMNHVNSSRRIILFIAWGRRLPANLVLPDFIVPEVYILLLIERDQIIKRVHLPSY